ncbi:MAG: lamin tail domain-containing protein [Anaerolineae bacterium]|nr:lamin tail domain-containing protein [Anaerolineae bacterium]
MSRRVLVGFLFLNVLVSLAVAVFLISYDRSQRPVERLEGPTQIVILTATPLPGLLLQPAEYQATIDSQDLTIAALSQRPPSVIMITATLEPEEGVVVPDVTAVATIDPALLPSIPTDLPPGTPTATPRDDGCIRHEVVSGDTFIGIAQQYGVYPGDIMLANDLDENHVLQIGEEFIIPVEGCDALNTPTPIPEPTNTPFALTRGAPTVTAAPTSINAQVEIVDVRFAGNVNSEEVEIRNLGNVVNLQGWRLINERGDAFVFPEFRMQPGSRVRIFSRQGPTTPAALYWGRETPAWQDGELVSLLDATGDIQSVFRIGETTPLFQEATEVPSE